MAVAPPKGLHTAGRHLWRSIAAVYVLQPHELSILRDVCRCEDLASSLWPRALSDPEAAVAWRLAVEEKRKLLVTLKLPVEDAPARPQRSLRAVEVGV